MSTVTLYICPKCESPTVDVPALVGGTFVCRACGHTGTSADFPGIVAAAPLGAEDAALNAFASDIKDVVAKDIAVPLGRILVKYGFVSNPPTVPEMSRYLSAIAASLAKSMILTQEADVIAKARKAVKNREKLCN